jgi:P-type Mg2+ transporter
MNEQKTTLETSQRPVNSSRVNSTHSSDQLLEKARTDTDAVLKELKSQTGGLSTAEAGSRSRQYGLNEIAREKRQSTLMRLLINFKNPLVILLLVLGFVSFLTGDLRAMVVIFVMVLLGVVLRFFQELRADDAAEKLKAMITTTATVVRDDQEVEVPLKLLVPGDIIRLAAGDMTPADVRVLSAKDLFLNQAALTGESLPVEKKADLAPVEIQNPLDLPNICFLGSNVESGSGTAVVIHIGDQTYLGSLAASIVSQRVLTSFDIGINKFTWLMIRFIAVMVPAVFLINGFSKHNWLEAFLFALAVAVGLTPEMLPMIVTVNLSKGALAMSKKKVIVKRLNSIQNFGAMDVLCTDKTGTITQGKIVLEKYLDIHGEPSEKVLQYGYLNSYHHTGLKNLLDAAILDHEELEDGLKAKEKYHKIDEIPFDFIRKRMSVIVEDTAGLNTLICKGAVEEVMSLCTRVEVDGKTLVMLPEYHDKGGQIASDLNGQGFRVIALAYKEMPSATDEPTYAVKDESDLILLGFLSFPAKRHRRAGPEADARFKSGYQDSYWR